MTEQKKYYMISCVFAVLSSIISIIITSVIDIFSGTPWSYEMPGEPTMVDHVVENIALYFGFVCVQWIVFCFLAKIRKWKVCVKDYLVFGLLFVTISIVVLTGYIFIGIQIGE